MIILTIITVMNYINGTSKMIIILTKLIAFSGFSA